MKKNAAVICMAVVLWLLPALALAQVAAAKAKVAALKPKDYPTPADRVRGGLPARRGDGRHRPDPGQAYGGLY